VDHHLRSPELDSSPTGCEFVGVVFVACYLAAATGFVELGREGIVHLSAEGSGCIFRHGGGGYHDQVDIAVVSICLSIDVAVHIVGDSRVRV
jgi:hypothetical protein